MEKLLKMIKYKLINILKELDSLEWSSLRKHLLMYTRLESDNYNLFEILRQNISKLNQNKDVIALHEKYFSRMSSKSFTNMLSRVTLWTENWIVYEEVKKDEHTTNGILLNYYNQKGLYKEANNTALKAEKKLIKEKGENLDKHKHLSKIYHAQYYSNNPIKYESGTELLQKIVTTRLEEYGIQLALYKLELHNWGEIKNHDYSSSLDTLNKILVHASENPTIQSLELLSTLFTTRESKYLYLVFEKLKSGFFKKGSQLELIVVLYLTSLSVRLWTENKLDDPQFMIQVHDFSLETGVLLSSGKIPLVRWYNILAVIASVSSKNEANDFVSKWIDKVVSKNNEKSKKLSNALVSFYCEDYKDIKNQLENVSFSTESEKYRSLALIIISDYKNRHEDFSAFIDSYKNAIRNLKRNKSKISKNRYQKYFNLLTVLYKISQSNFSWKTTSFSIPDNIIYKKWLLKEISQANK